MRGDERLVELGGNALATAQQYCFSHGHKDLIEWIKTFTNQRHQATVELDIVVTSGAVNGISNIISVLADRGSRIIVDQYSYTHVTESLLTPRGMELVPVASDDGGMNPSALEAVLGTGMTDGARPRLLYLIPTGHNPTGFTMTLERKRAIYEICSQHDVVIIEDDAYYWLQWDVDEKTEAPGCSLPPSFLSIDTESRVIRVDTFSKLLGPGYRIGWVTCHPLLALKIGQSIQGQSVGASTFSMAMISKILQSWGESGFDSFLRHTQKIYRGRAKAAIESASLLCDENGKPLARIVTAPRAGMFLWLQLLIQVNEETEGIVSKSFLDHGVVALPGSLFRSLTSKGPSPDPCPFIRVSFGGLDEEKIIRGFERIRAALREIYRNA
jgi:DNA-binding transcriptional MocR family regulator